MAGTALWVGLTMKDVLAGGGTINLQQTPIGAMLTTGYAFNQDTHHFLSDAIASEITGTGYTALGATVSGSTVSYGTASNQARWDLNDPTWTSASFSASQMILYYRFSGGTTTTWPILQYVEFGGTQTVASGTFTYQVPDVSVGGAGQITVA